MSDQVHLLKSRRFLPLFVTQFMGAFNDNAFKNSFLIWYTYDVAVGNGLEPQKLVTIAAGLFILPFFLFSATAGQLADKFEKSLLIRRIKIVEIMLMIACVVGFYMQSVYFLLVILFLMGVQSTFFGPLKYSILPDHLKDDELISGNAIIEAGTFLSILLGTIFGGIIIRTEYGVEIISITILSISVIGWLSSRSIPVSEPADASISINKNILGEMLNIVKYARANESVWLSIIGISWFWFVGATFLTQFTPYTKEIILGNEHIITMFLTLFSAGIGIGSLFCNKLLNGNISAKFVPLGCILITIFTVDLYFATQGFINDFSKSGLQESLVLSGELLNIGQFVEISMHSKRIIFDLLMISISSGIYIVPLYAIMQHRSEEKYLARIIACNNILNAFFMVVSSIAALILFSHDIEIHELFLIMAITNFFIYFIVKKLVKEKTPKE